ncbi:hypothetical protein [Streptomyces phytophilus]|uniref:hypothetical protein n=1 Tax=Streptomyces phytophilus TaxID=722715 RepID=UPI0015F05D15|nr:hypothetical protein [Streptomyces phytophilus]
MSRLVPRFRTTADLVEATNDVREQVVRGLAEYVGLAARMREFEDAFSAQVLHAAQQLHEVIGRRKHLEAELERIRSRIDRGGYGSADEIEDDVRAVLDAARADAEAADADAASPGEAEEPADATGDGLDEAARKRILRDFKRIVLPSVHADTSDTSFSDFDIAYSAYKARDFVLMEALVVQYRGPVGAAEDDGRTVTREEAEARLREYRAAARRLEDRLRALRREITQDERDHPEQTRQRMRERNEQIRRSIDAEAERVLLLRRRLETLADGARDEDGASL